MPDIAVFHPQIVHFVVALAIVGVLLRLIALSGKLPFTGPSATTLLLLAAGASWFAVDSGLDAHGAAERIPGARSAVTEHEDWGTRARNLLLIVGGLEVAGLALRRRERYRKIALIASAAVGVLAVGAVYEAAEHGGELVYAYAGGVGTRSGEPEDVDRLFLAGLYNEAQRDRRAGQPEAAAELTSLMARRFPDNTDVQYLLIESLIRDRDDGAAALAKLDAMPAPGDSPRARYRVGMLRVDAYAAMGEKDSAVAVLQGLMKDFPTSQRLQQRLVELQR